jgi:hypothetical protein
LDGELPEALRADSTGGCEAWRMAWRLEEISVRDAQARAASRALFPGLQARYDRDAIDYRAEAASLLARGDTPALHRLATTFMQHAAERFEEACENVCGEAEPAHVGLPEMSTPVTF